MILGLLVPVFGLWVVYITFLSVPPKGDASDLSQGGDLRQKGD